jgi:antitoxin ParD1/3/4
MRVLLLPEQLKKELRTQTAKIKRTRSMTITIEIPQDIERQIHENIARGNADGVRRLLIEALGPTVEELMQSHTPSTLSDAEFELLADQLADEFMEYVGPDLPPLSDYAVSREGLYEDHL